MVFFPNGGAAPVKLLKLGGRAVWEVLLAQLARVAACRTAVWGWTSQKRFDVVEERLDCEAQCAMRNRQRGIASYVQRSSALFPIHTCLPSLYACISHHIIASPGAACPRTPSLCV